MKVLEISTKKRAEFIDITSRVENVLHQEKVNDGICIVFCPHTTAGLTINENADPSVKSDITKHLEEIVPADKRYAHLEGNADSHIKSSLVGSSLHIIVDGGRFMLGTWQGIYFCEFDGPRRRQVYVKAIQD